MAVPSLDELRRIEVIADQPNRLEAVQEPGPALSPTVEASASFESRAAARGQLRKTQSRHLFEPARKARGRTLAHTDGRNI